MGPALTQVNSYIHPALKTSYFAYLQTLHPVKHTRTEMNGMLEI